VLLVLALMLSIMLSYHRTETHRMAWLWRLSSSQHTAQFHCSLL